MNDLFLRRKTVNGTKRKVRKISKSTILVLQEAENLGIDWQKMPYTSLFKLQHNGVDKYFHAQTPSETTAFAHYCCKNKQVAKNILHEEGINVPKGYFIKSSDTQKYLLDLFRNLNKPLVVKPVDGLQGNNVYINLKSQKDYLSAIKKIKKFYGKKTINLLVEEMFDAQEYRILATQEKVLSIIQRIPANVVGDGQSTIQELIDVKNLQPIRSVVATYKPIIINQNALEYLEEQGYSLNSILDKNQQLFLQKHSPLDISLGGDTIDVTDKVHPSVHEISMKIMHTIPGLSLSGIDYMSTDIFAEQNPDNYRIIEINASPSLDWNQYPIKGEERNIAKDFIQIMFPEII
jgi:cyanophycin synthetase